MASIGFSAPLHFLRVVDTSGACVYQLLALCDNGNTVHQTLSTITEKVCYLCSNVNKQGKTNVTSSLTSLNKKTVFPGIGIPMLKISRSWDRLIFNMGSLYR